MNKEELKQQIREEIQCFMEHHEEMLDYLNMSEKEYKEIMENDID